MKKSLKILLLLFFSFILFTCYKHVDANSINKLSMDIFIDDNGNATVTEVWDCNVTEGTETYHPYYNLGNSKITNLTVKDESSTYTTLDFWNTSGNLASKANKCGINKVSDGVELCWGISSYGSHIYTVKYTITNFVSELTDSQMIYWTLIPYDFSNSIGNVYIKIHTNFSIPDTVDVWGYGNYGGTAYVYNGYIEMQSDGRLNKNEYMTILVKFPPETFSTANSLDYDFNHYYTMAQEGATAYKQKAKSSFFSILASIFDFTLSIVFFVILPIFIAIMSAQGKYDILSKDRKLTKDIPYFRDIPCQNNLFRAYYIGYQYGIFKNKTDILGSIILKWLKNSIIKIDQKESGTIFRKENTVIILNETDPDLILDEKEKELFEMLLKASKDGILESKEFERWCNRSYSKILDWFDEILKRERQNLVNQELLSPITTGFIFKHKKYKPSPQIIQEATELAGLKKYLNDYTLISDRAAIEVHLFEDYLIYAQMMGIAKKVAKEFKDLYPEVIEQSKFSSYDNIIFINYCSSNGISHANTAKARAESYSSGGGGFSSGGGGGGSFGGGGGGRRFPLKAKHFMFRQISLLFNFIH